MENFRFRVKRLSGPTLFETTDQEIKEARRTWELLNYKFPEMDGYRIDIFRLMDGKFQIQGKKTIWPNTV